jgi:hypothetical protein
MPTDDNDKALIVPASDERYDVASVRPRCLKLRVSSKPQQFGKFPAQA